MREHGRRRSQHDISADPGAVGELSFASVGPVYLLNLNDPNSSVNAPLYPALFEARLTTMHGEAMLFKGEERPDGQDGPFYVQEWSVRLEPRGSERQ